MCLCGQWRGTCPTPEGVSYTGPGEGRKADKEGEEGRWRKEGWKVKEGRMEGGGRKIKGKEGRERKNGR